MSTYTAEEFEAFVKIHQPQLDSISFPKALNTRLYQKLKSEEYDIGTRVRLIINKDIDKMMVAATENISENEDVYLIDHAWTFKYYEAYNTLKENKKLRYRMKNILNYSAKISVTNVSEEHKTERPNLLEYLKDMPDGPTIYNLDEYGIQGLDNINFKEDATEISLFGNKISDPYTVTDNLVKLENLKALWLNDNPIEQMCHNFDEIGEFLKSLEIINSKFTSKAGKWALLFCCKDQNIENFVDVKYLDLSGRDFLKIEDLTVFDEMVNLETLDISDHKNLLTAQSEEKGKVEKEIEGQKFEETGNFHTLDQFLKTVPQIKHLVCDDDVVEYIIKLNNESTLKDLLPNLQTVNKIGIQVSIDDYKTEKEVQEVLSRLWRYANTYRFSSTNKQDDNENYWYIMDEVGSSFMHSDVANIELHPFIFCSDLINTELSEGTVSPDPNQRITFSIAWPKKDITKDEIMYRDFLPRITEDEFRSARLSVWFKTPNKYYEDALQEYNSFEEMKDREEKFEENQNMDSKFLDKLKELERPVKVLPIYVSLII